MPEGPEVRLVADSLLPALGEMFHKSEIIDPDPKKLHRFSKKTPEGWTQLQSQWTVEDIDVFGKRIVINISLPSGHKFSILNTLGMSGTWVWDKPDYPHTRLRFTSLMGRVLSFVDIRSFGTFKAIPRGEMTKIIRTYGWDLLRMPAPDPLWLSFQKTKRLGRMPVGFALVQQFLFQGIGSIYRSEILYKCRLNPHWLVKDILPDRWLEVNQVAHQILYDSYFRGGSSIRDFHANEKKGTNQEFLKIYKKKEVPEGPVETVVFKDSRRTWWCPNMVQELENVEVA